MCGRYYSRADKQRLAERFHLRVVPDVPLAPDYNVAPTTFQPVIRIGRDSGERELSLMRWGLIPYFAKSLAGFKGFSTINARAETLTKSATFRVRFSAAAAWFRPMVSMSGRGSASPPKQRASLMRSR